MDDGIIKEYYLIIKNKISQADFISALRNVDKLLYNFPSDSCGYYYKGVCHFAQEKYEESIEDYITALKLNSNFAKAYFNLGVSYYILNKYDDALINIAKALLIFVSQKELASKRRCIDALKLINIEQKG